ncbi:MAG: Crp/Fnr family transcriptional regulator [Lachnospiraceae bacterium]|nr:Crp/Fnr family transcriptional regulator [Lachnospiraceae bacterium]
MDENVYSIDCFDTAAEQIPFLSSMPGTQKKLLIDNSTRKAKRKGSFLFREGEAVDALYIILDGRVKLMRYDSEGREQIVGIFSKGETIWEGLLIDDSQFPYSAVCLEKSLICIINKCDFTKVLSDSNVALNIIAMLSRKLHDANERNLLLSTRDPKTRLAAFLIYRQKRDHADTIDLQLSDIAASLSMRPETVSRKITELIDEGLIRRSGKSSIKILNFEGLEGLTI